MICVSFPTIMSGLVLRWYEDEAGHAAHREIANAGRECFMILDDCPPALRAEVHDLADKAHSYLTVEYAARLHPRLDVSRWVTHRRVGGLLSEKIEPISAHPEPESRA